jgi:hypothetical protein
MSAMRLLLLFLLMGLPAWADDAGSTGVTVARIPVTFTGGHETDPRDRGRPVILIAAALKVSPEVFRAAFSHVKPAGAGQQPQPDQVRKNKAALMAALGPLGVTDDRLNEVSNHYRYSRSRGEMWPTSAATAYAIVRNGIVTGFTVTNPGSGYSSPPEVSIEGMPGVHATAALVFDTDFDKNGAIKEIALSPKTGP